MFEKLCPRCIDAIRSRGEKVFVGTEIDYDEYRETHGEEATCDWCGEEDVELREVIIP